MNIYYKIWSDMIYQVKEKTTGGSLDWHFTTLAGMVFLMTFNVLTLLMTVRIFTGYTILGMGDSFFESIDSGMIRGALWITLYFFIPISTINYFLVFHKKKYEKITEKYKHRNGKLALVYYAVTFALFFGVGIINNLPQFRAVL